MCHQTFHGDQNTDCFVDFILLTLRKEERAGCVNCTYGLNKNISTAFIRKCICAFVHLCICAFMISFSFSKGASFFLLFFVSGHKIERSQTSCKFTINTGDTKISNVIGSMQQQQPKWRGVRPLLLTAVTQ